MTKKAFIFLGLLFSISQNSFALEGTRCSAYLVPGSGATGGGDYCQIRVDGKNYKTAIASKCFCPPDSELPPADDTIRVPVVEYPEDMVPSKKNTIKEKAPIKVYGLIDGNKKKSINFNCKSKMVINVDDDEKPTGLVSCQYIHVEPSSSGKNEKIISEMRIDDDSKDQAYAKSLCQCKKKMNIPQSELTPYGMNLLNAVKNSNECKLISTALSSDRLFQFCLIETGGKQQVSYGRILNECKDACENRKEACSLNIKKDSALSQEEKIKQEGDLAK